MPTLFVCHGAGPSFFTRWPFGPPDAWDGIRDWLASALATLPEPKAVLMVSAHFAADPVRVTTGVAPRQLELEAMQRFPAEVPDLTHPLIGSPALAARVLELLARASIEGVGDDDQGFDHGTWIPLKVMDPERSLPVVALSLRSDLNAAFHCALGQALAPLREEGVLILGSGASFHNMQPDEEALRLAPAFDTWLEEAVAAPDRLTRLADWESAPGARPAHPTEEHLIPLMVVAGAGAGDPGVVVHRAIVPARGPELSAPMSAFRFG